MTVPDPQRVRAVAGKCIVLFALKPHISNTSQSTQICCLVVSKWLYRKLSFEMPYWPVLNPILVVSHICKRIFEFWPWLEINLFPKTCFGIFDHSWQTTFVIRQGDNGIKRSEQLKNRVCKEGWRSWTWCDHNLSRVIFAEFTFCSWRKNTFLIKKIHAFGIWFISISLHLINNYGATGTGWANGAFGFFYSCFEKCFSPLLLLSTFSQKPIRIFINNVVDGRFYQTVKSIFVWFILRLHVRYVTGGEAFRGLFHQIIYDFDKSEN